MLFRRIKDSKMVLSKNHIYPSCKNLEAKSAFTFPSFRRDHLMKTSKSSKNFKNPTKCQKFNSGVFHSRILTFSEQKLMKNYTNKNRKQENKKKKDERKKENEKRVKREKKEKKKV